MTEHLPDRALTFDEWRTAVRDYTHGLIASLNVMCGDYLHPVGAATIHSWMSGMRLAAEDGDLVEVLRLAGMVREKIALERAWEPETESWMRAHNA